MEKTSPRPVDGITPQRVATKWLFNLQLNTRRSLTRFVPTRPSLKDYSQEGISESPRFEAVGTTANESDRIIGLLDE
jgi:hypothetical protein